MTNSKSTKRALLTSALSILMCVAMLIGTTFAWFTDSATTGVNKIQAGTLDVALEMKENGEWVSAEGKTLNFVKAAGHENEEILWEPGCTYSLPELRITNKGNLALKYKLMITGILGDAKLNEVIEWTISNGDAKLVDAGVDQSFNNQEYYLLKGDSNTLTIEGHMDELAGNDYQDLTIDGVSITVVATQYTYESDSKDNQYDKDAKYDLDVWTGDTEELTFENNVCHITSAAQFAKLMDETHNVNSVYAGKTFILDKDLDFAGRTINGVGSYSANIEFTFDGNGHTISNFVINSTSDYYAGLFNQFNGTVKNLTVKNATVSGKAMVGAIAANGDTGAVIENCKVYDCTLIGKKKVGAVVGYIAGATVKNCYAEDCTVICADSRDDQAAEVIGYVNTGCTTDNNTYKNVTVLKNATTVSNAAELKEALPSNVGGQYTDGGTILLTADIDMTGWTSLNGNYCNFVLDGQGHSLKNQTEALYEHLGVGTYTIKNVSFENANIARNDTDRDWDAGVIVYEMQNNDGVSLTVENCHVKDSQIYGYKYAGGFIGFTNESNTAGKPAIVNIKDCTVTNTTISTDDSSAGGLVGHGRPNQMNITNCKILGTTSIKCAEDRKNSPAKAGYLVGTVNGGTTTIKNCEVATTVTLTNVNASSTVGNGLVGRNVGGTVVKN